MMDAAFSTMSSIDICSQIESHPPLLQFASSDSGSPVANTSPLMHNMQPLLSDMPDTLSEYVDRLPKEDIMLMSTVVENYVEVTDQKTNSNIHNLTSQPYSEHFAVAGAMDIKSSFEMLSSASDALSELSSSSAVPYHVSVPAGPVLNTQSQYYFQAVNSKLHSPLPEHSNSSPIPVTATTAQSAASSPLITQADSSASVGQVEMLPFGSPRLSKPDLPAPPKKPLTPYMRFSKGIWQQVKGTNPGLSVCEVGATIGRMWRELSDFQKQQFNEDFANDKVRYDGELQNYLISNGLQASDLVKPRGKKKKVPTATLR